ncbi:hypothetical protein UJ101_00833 [Flavobacteriaceae bacterium UJ101]|nr:hypothetical protein UJ101_00833 [Flavobacteriaceae bacterium UJ101]
MKRILLVFLTLTINTLLFAQENDSITLSKSELQKEIEKEVNRQLAQKENLKSTKKSFNNLLKWDNISLKGYGVVNYYNYDYDTDPNLRDKVDPERLNLYLDYYFTDWLAFKSEIEFEHGGTGSTIELDTQEEFGEFEQEIEAGGEVKLEQVYVDIKIKPWLNVKAGRFKNYFGIAQNLDTPDEYFTTHRPEMENALLPIGFYETGLEANGTFLKRLNYRLALTNGLDATGFNSSGWIKDGYQTRFEMMNADAFALTARLDYKFGTHKNTYAGAAVYVGDSAANRPKDDMSETAYVSMVEGHVTISEHPWRLNSMILFGNLENSDIVSQKNANLSNNLGVKRTPVGQQALGFHAEIGYDVLHLLNHQGKMMLYPFFRYDYYDSMYAVEGAVVDNPRWERSNFTGGVNWFIHPQVIAKAQYSYRRLGSENYDQTTLIPTGKKQVEKTFSAGIGFVF